MPIDKTKFLDQFKAETQDHLQNLNDGLLDLEKNPGSPELLTMLMREAHTIKGSAKMMDFLLIAEIAHKMEDGFEKAAEETKTITKQHFDILFEALDTIESLLEDTLVRKAKSIEEPDIMTLCDRIIRVFDGDLTDSETETAATNDSENDTPQPVETKTEEAKTEEPPVEETTSDETAPPQQSNEKQQPTESAAQEAKNEASSPVASEPKGASAVATKKQAEQIRVNIRKLDSLVNISGEMLTAKLRLSELIHTLNDKVESNRELCTSLGKLPAELRDINDNIDFITANIQDDILSLRMTPIKGLFDVFPRSIRDLAQEHNKDILLKISGEETHLDTTIIEELKAPLMHLLRNSIDHGIEDPETRKSKNKFPTGIISLHAYQAGSQIIIEVSDDGAGIDIEKVKEKAIRKGLIDKSDAMHLSKDQAIRFLFHSGFSTRDNVTQTSGRGVGLDVVAQSLEKLKGTIDIESQKDKGTKFILKLPLTLSIIEILRIAVGNEIFAIPIDNVVETARFQLDQIESASGHEVISLRDTIIPLIRITRLFSLPRKGIVEKKYFPVIIVQSSEKKLGLLVDEILGHQEIVIKPLGYPLKRVRNVSGGAILGDGRIVLILDIPSLIAKTIDTSVALQEVFSQQANDIAINQTKTILLAEDTMTTAMIEKDVLESAGYNVVHAQNGKLALDKAMQEKFDLIISDVLMPVMNGFELTENLKSHSQTKNTPVIIVTTRENDKDIRRGMEAGADAYILKKDFTSDTLLETIDRLMN